MGKLQVCKIEFDDVRGVYTPGQDVTGTLIIELEKDLNIRMKCVGWGEVHWTQTIQSVGPGQKPKSETIHINGEESYFKSVIALYGKGAVEPRYLERDTTKKIFQDIREFEISRVKILKNDRWLGSPTVDTGEWLPQGRHLFHFSFTLPSMLPSSYNDKYGNIVYEVSAVLDLDYWSSNEIVRKEFKVVSDLDLNKYPAAEEPTEIQNLKYLCCWCCKSGPITGILRVCKTGYVAGDSVLFDFTIKNRSRRVCGVLVLFIKETVYHAKGEKKVCVTELDKSRYEDVMPGETQSWDDEEFEVPSIPPPCLEGCKIITIDHYIKLEIYPSGPAFHLTVPLKLIIGSIPSYGLYHLGVK